LQFPLHWRRVRERGLILETTRQNKIARLIQKELSDIFQKQTSAMRGVLVSVSACRISPDLSVCRVYLSVFPSERAEEIVQNINVNQKQVRFELGTRVGKQLRIIPELKFFVDDSLDYVEHIDELLKASPGPSKGGEN
jgi:ribosome-binding factor A